VVGGRRSLKTLIGVEGDPAHRMFAFNYRPSDQASPACLSAIVERVFAGRVPLNPSRVDRTGSALAYL
jgi:hypothetical protein